MKNIMQKHTLANNILLAVAVAVLGFVLLNMTFIFDALIQRMMDGIIQLFTPADINMAWAWFPPVKHVMFVIIIGLISWLVFRSKLGVFYKAVYLTVPLAVVFVTLGMFLYHWPMAVYSLGGLFCVGLLYYFYRSRQPWIYYYALILISVTMLLVTIMGVEI